MPRHKVSPLRGEEGVQGEGREQAEAEGETRIELGEDLPGAAIMFMGVGAGEMEVGLVEGSLGEEVGAGGGRIRLR